MRTMVVIIAGLLLTTLAASAQTPGFEAWGSRQSNVEYYATNYGIFGLNVAESKGGFGYPRGDAHGYIFGAGLWFGAVDNAAGSSPMVFITYNPNSGASWAVPGEYDTTVSMAPLYTSIDYERAAGRYIGPRLPAYVPNWPLWTDAAGHVSPMEPGMFERNEGWRNVDSGTYVAPAFVPGVDEQMVSRFNDGDIRRYERHDTTAPYPIGLQFQQNIYSWASGIFNGTVVVQYEIINRSGDTLHDCTLAQVTDPDIGSPGNDHIRLYIARPELRSCYAWSEDEAVQYGTLVMTLLESPVVSAGLVDNRRRGEYMSGGRIRTLPPWTIQGDPQTDSERYAFMNSGQIAVSQGPGDMRCLMAGSSFSMRPGDTAHFAVAYTVLPVVPDTVRGTVAGLDTTIGRLIEDYYLNGFEGDASVPSGARAGDGGMTVVPNPASSVADITFAPGNADAVTVVLVDALGEVVRRFRLPALAAGAGRARVDLAGVPTGVYWIYLEGAGMHAVHRLDVVR